MGKKWQTAFLPMAGSGVVLPSRAEMLRKYLNEVFVETGTYEGGGVATALEAGFKHVYSIEIAPRYYHIALSCFRDDPRVHLFLGDSALLMRRVLEEVKVPATFWIDAHLPQDGAQHLPIWGNNPVLFELVAIAQHSCNREALQEAQRKRPTMHLTISKFCFGIVPLLDYPISP
jgi:hypothetical protein